MSKMTTADLLHALVKYDEIVHDNALNTDDRDVMVVVATDKHGEVAYEIEECGGLGFGRDDRDLLPWSELRWKFAALYKECIALEIEQRPHTITGDQRDCVHLDDLTVGELEVLRLDPGRRFELPCPVCVVDKIRDRTKGATT